VNVAQESRIESSIVPDEDGEAFEVREGRESG